MGDTAYKISVMQAYERGEKIECCGNSEGIWWEATDIVWNWAHCNYRVIPKPKIPVVCWAEVNDNNQIITLFPSPFMAVGPCRSRLIKLREVADE